MGSSSEPAFGRALVTISNQTSPATLLGILLMSLGICRREYRLHNIVDIVNVLSWSTGCKEKCKSLVASRTGAPAKGSDA